MSTWTEALIPDQSGRVVLITGANSGIGLQPARALAEHGAHVVMACRSRPKAEAARDQILAAAPSAQGSLVDLDLTSLAAVQVATAEVIGRFDSLDVLINNAGVMATPHEVTVDGYELQFATNHLGHAALTAHLLPLLLATDASRVVTVSSLAHRFGKIAFDDLQSQRGYRAWRAYGQSKLANLLFTFELQRRLAAAGAGTVAVAAHPGVSDTNLAGSTGGLTGTLMSATKPLAKLFSQSSQMGALPTLRAAVDPAVRGGEYVGPDGFMEQRGHPQVVQASAAANDTAVAARLWDVTVELTGVPFQGLG
ncbi:MAG: SDR family NAD(P)-dependent oxidoreductase [Actinobacteria bacterium]|nr:SDR family NAD(P)-dependent oxidoreductase [Actinomycetota bacterium]